MGRVEELGLLGFIALIGLRGGIGCIRLGLIGFIIRFRAYGV